MGPILSLAGIIKTFSEDGNVCPALGGISFDVFAREIVCIMGPSGCGKTTLLRIIGGLEHADSGTIREEAGSSGPGFPFHLSMTDQGMDFLPRPVS